MFPIILVSKSLEKQLEWVDEYKKGENFPAYYIFEIRPTKSELSIDQIRQVKQEIKTGIKGRRLFILYDFHTASAEAQNALLKTLEEKNESNQFILVVNSIGAVLPTIQSRSRTVSLDLASQAFTLRETTQKLLQLIENDKIVTFLNNELISGINRENAILLLQEIIVYLQQKLITGDTTVVVPLKQSLEVLSLLTTNNLNPQLAIDSFLISYKRTLLQQK